MSQGNGSSNGGRRHHAGGTTGRYLVLLAEDATDAAVRHLENKAGIRVENFAAFAKAASAEPEDVGEGSVFFDQLGVALVTTPPDQHKALLSMVAETTSPILAVEPERIVYAITQAGFEMPIDGGAPSPLVTPRVEEVGLLTPPEGLAAAPLPVQSVAEFLRGYQAAVNGIVDHLLSGQRVLEAPRALRELEATVAGATWGLAATGVVSSVFSGRGVKVAVLDTGMNVQHPDFFGRQIQSMSFVSGQAVQDGHRHGTHCIGTSCGSRTPAGSAPRYGVATEATIYAGKVLNNSGRGSDGAILAGINWAVASGCAVVSMSLGAPVLPGQAYSEVFQETARRAAARGTLIVAAAGNESRRPTRVEPVGHPANCPSILAVAALDRALAVAYFSCGGLNPNGGEVNIAGPGVDIFSTWPMPARYNTISGTSMATPHVAGITALYAEATGERGFPLANSMLRRSRRLSPIRDFGWGLVQSV